MNRIPEIRQLKSLAKMLLGKSVPVPHKVAVDHVVLGSHYNEWPLVPELMSSESVVYSFGVGHDVSFDLAAIERFSCPIYAFDPTPRSVKWIHEQVLPEKFHFVELGIGGQTGELVFDPPKDPTHVSYSVPTESGRGQESIRVEVHDLKSILERMHHTRLDVLKLDVEGCEYAIIDSLSRQTAYPEQLMIEFHHGLYGYKTDDTKQALSTLLREGYLPYYVSETGREIGFVREESFSKLKAHSHGIVH